MNISPLANILTYYEICLTVDYTQKSLLDWGEGGMKQTLPVYSPSPLQTGTETCKEVRLQMSPPSYLKKNPDN